MAQTTIVPFSSLPTCAYACGHLYDANGACVPPAVSTGNLNSYASCFCADSRVAAFSTGTAGVCDSACTAAADSGGLASIHTWFSTFCAEYAHDVVATTTSSSSSATGTNSSSSGKKSSGNTTWLSSHWRWVVFIIVVVVGIAGIWIGACIWRRHYLRKRDNMHSLATRASTSTTGAVGSGIDDPHSQNSMQMPQVGFFTPTDASAATAYESEKLTKGRRKQMQ